MLSMTNTNLALSAARNAKINDIKNKIPNIANLATTQLLLLFQRKYLSIMNISLLQNLISQQQNFAATLTQASLASKYDIANFVKKTDFHDILKYLDRKKFFK